jgi:hypothetical protein
MELLAELTPITWCSVTAGLLVLWVFLIRHFYYPPRNR